MKLISLLLAAAVVAAAIYFLLKEFDREATVAAEPVTASEPAATPAAKPDGAETGKSASEPPRTVLGKAYQHSKSTVEDSYSEHDAALDAVMNAQ